MRKHKRRESKRYSSRLIKELIKLAKEDLLKESEFKPIKIPPKEILISDTDRITRISLVNKDRKIIEVVNVSYEIKIDNVWITIVRYDSSHGYLHRHVTFSLDNPDEIMDTSGVVREGDPHKWYTWAIKDIQKRYIEYRKGFTERSKISSLGY